MLTNLMWMVLLPYIITSKAKLYIMKVHNDGNLKSYMIETNSDTPHSFNGYDSAIEGGVESKEKASTKDPGPQAGKHKQDNQFFADVCMEDKIVYIGQDISETGKKVSNEQECHKYCEEESECEVWVYSKERKTCQLKRFHDNLRKENNNAYASGLKECPKGLNNLNGNERQTQSDYFFGSCFFFCPAQPPAPTVLQAPTTVSATTTEGITALWTQGKDVNCWRGCGEKGGLCITVCGPGGFCCRKGFNDCSEEAKKVAPSNHHSCVIQSAPTTVSATTTEAPTTVSATTTEGINNLSRNEIQTQNDDYMPHATPEPTGTIGLQERYSKMEDGHLCSGSWANITTEEDCKAAADELNLKWKDSWTGTGDFPGCLYAHDGRNEVYFNLSPNPKYTVNPNYAAICKTYNAGSTDTEAIQFKTSNAEAVKLEKGCLQEPDFNYPHNDLGAPVREVDWRACRASAMGVTNARYWTYRFLDSLCWLKSSNRNRRAEGTGELISGNVGCIEGSGEGSSGSASGLEEVSSGSGSGSEEDSSGSGEGGSGSMSESGGGSYRPTSGLREDSPRSGSWSEEDSSESGEGGPGSMSESGGESSRPTSGLREDSPRSGSSSEEDSSESEVCEDFGTPPVQGCKCLSEDEKKCFSPKICISGSCRKAIQKR